MWINRTLQTMLDHKPLRRAALLAYAVLIAWLSLRQTEAMPPGQWDKLGHLLAYAVFGWLGAGLADGRRALALMGAGIVAYSALMEVAQAFVPGRFPSALDLLANTIGVALGLALATRGFRAMRQAVAGPAPSAPPHDQASR